MAHVCMFVCYIYSTQNKSSISMSMVFKYDLIIVSWGPLRVVFEHIKDSCLETNHNGSQWKR